MRKFLIPKTCLLLSVVSLLSACEDPHYVYNNGTRYYDANDEAVDYLPGEPYTRGGQYFDNPEEATNTRDNRGMKSAGYGHNVNDDYRTPVSGSYPAGTMIYGDGTIVYPNGTVIYPDGRAVYPVGSTTTTTTTTRRTGYDTPY